LDTVAEALSVTAEVSDPAVRTTHRSEEPA